MKLSRKKQPKKFIQYRTHHEIDIEDDEEFEKVLREFGPTRVYVEDYTTIKFRTKKDATLFCLRNLS